VQVEAETGSGLPDFVKEEFDVFPDCGILVHGFMRLRCVDCTHEKPGCLFLQKTGILPFVRWAVHGADDCPPDRSRYSQCARAAMGAFIADSAASSIRGSSASALAGIAGHSTRHFHFFDQTGRIQTG